MESMKSSVSAPLPEDIAILFVAVRPPQDSFIDYVPFDATSKETLDRLLFATEQFTEFLDDKSRFGYGEHDPDDMKIEKPAKRTWLQRVKGMFCRG
jgi:hypothetical protein